MGSHGMGQTFQLDRISSGSVSGSASGHQPGSKIDPPGGHRYFDPAAWTQPYFHGYTLRQVRFMSQKQPELEQNAQCPLPMAILVCKNKLSAIGEGLETFTINSQTLTATKGNSLGLEKPPTEIHFGPRGCGLGSGLRPLRHCGCWSGTPAQRSCESSRDQTTTCRPCRRNPWYLTNETAHADLHEPTPCP